MSEDLLLYGSQLDSQQLESTLEHLFETNLKNEAANGERPTPICIWGTHGIGKTRLVQDFVK
ncbi:MAG TPA: ATPase, partial [Candidatus Handelsmanbacteria bacterium]|nr:ATPase [Candidatus Handelsmanbacteria bacterium]